VAVSVSKGGSGALQGALSDCDAEIGYRGPTACAAAGITYRQLDYWARTGLVEPSVRAAHGSGSQRLYGFRDILVLKVVKRLLDTGISLQQIRAAVRHLRDRGTEDLAQVTLMSDGVSVYECTSPDELVDLLAGGQGVFGIALGRVWQEVAGELAELPAVRAEDGLIATGTDELATRRARKTGLPAPDPLDCLLSQLSRPGETLTAPRGQGAEGATLPRNLSGTKDRRDRHSGAGSATDGESRPGRLRERRFVLFLGSSHRSVSRRAAGDARHARLFLP
jgi:DNA-binding transcriptional MerR regulator